jgi:hypothetical protein
MRCQDWYDAGNKALGDPDTTNLRRWKVIAGPPGLEIGSDHYTGVFGREPIPMWRGRDGFYIACKHCNEEFESKGLRCCSKECETAYRETEERRAKMKEAGIEPSNRRMCQAPACDRPIPKWKNGRQVSSKVQFCSPLCRKRAAKSVAPF